MTGDDRGVALAIVLWAVVALSLMAAAMGVSARNTALIGRNAWTELEVRTAADTAVQTATLSLFDARPRAPLDGRDRPPSDGVTVAIRDEAGLIDINYAGRNMLRDYFKAAGAGMSEANLIADRVVAWRAPKSGDGIAVSGFHPRGAPFQSVDELRLMAGIEPAFFARIAPGLTVYSHRPYFDMRSAPKEVLGLIPGMDRKGIENAIAARQPEAALPGHAYTISVTAARGTTRVSRRAVVVLSGDPAQPYWIADWR